MRSRKNSNENCFEKYLFSIIYLRFKKKMYKALINKLDHKKWYKIKTFKKFTEMYPKRCKVCGKKFYELHLNFITGVTKIKSLVATQLYIRAKHGSYDESLEFGTPLHNACIKRAHYKYRASSNLRIKQAFRFAKRMIDMRLRDIQYKVKEKEAQAALEKSLKLQTSSDVEIEAIKTKIKIKILKD